MLLTCWLIMLNVDENTSLSQTWFEWSERMTWDREAIYIERKGLE